MSSPSASRRMPGRPLKLRKHQRKMLSSYFKQIGAAAAAAAVHFEANTNTVCWRKRAHLLYFVRGITPTCRCGRSTYKHGGCTRGLSSLTRVQTNKELYVCVCYSICRTSSIVGYNSLSCTSKLFPHQLYNRGSCFSFFPGNLAGGNWWECSFM